MACWLVTVTVTFCGKVKSMFYYTQLNVKYLTHIMSIVLEQSALRWQLNLPVNCKIGSLSTHSHSFNLSAFRIPPNFSKMTFSITDVSLFQKRIGSNFPFILHSDLYFTYLWNPFDSYYHSVKQTEECVK